ncbi:quinone oxidoreductase [Actinokineospora sp. UTMC 2448]|uniref:quinone oxidoreductase family protein n=1 Tax=Actinokineospora sp. UTMC 2448 TaxID=2268449 RepID=UPI0021646525|nr:quinone oxidoreductase [Actinokineospora sp. UTMC 2448]UVS80120.1 Quinone oxidoreductase 1 [Actinokineospora sp. UTMC 2448]
MPTAVLVSETGGPEVLTVTEAEPGSPGPGEVLVDVAAAGVNYIDTYHRSGAYPLPLPFRIGLEGAGTVTAVGEGADAKVGDRIAWSSTLGSYAAQVVVPVAAAVPVPDGVDDQTAAALMLQGLTAHYLLTSTYAVQPGDTVLVHAAAGGVGLLLTQLATARGARVIGTVSTAEKAELARAAGAAEVIRYDQVDFAPAVRELTGGDGVAAVYDGVGASTFDGSLDSLRRRGVLALFGAASGPVPPVDPQRLNRAGSVFLTRPTLADHVVTTQELRGRAADLFDAVLAGELSVRIGATYALDDARTAHEDLEGRRTTGKVLLIP